MSIESSNTHNFFEIRGFHYGRNNIDYREIENSETFPNRNRITDSRALEVEQIRSLITVWMEMERSEKLLIF